MIFKVEWWRTTLVEIGTFGGNGGKAKENLMMKGWCNDVTILNDS